ncbi:unnamed protein product [Aphis gossypii]|uniref:Uncharacterized protein n=1 Tax=Aphis gossypii TaxID=80765 RepID=A0A9P0NL45_APHGO|nr:unnamed protein product [Aphis gossypii]
MKTFISYTFVLYCFVVWSMTVNSHYIQKNILKRISRSNLQEVNNSISSNSTISTKPNENVGGIDSIVSSTLFTTNVPIETSLTSEMTTLRHQNNSINEVDTFQNTLPDQNYGNFVIVIFFSAMLILILGLLFIVMYKKHGNSFYQVRGIRRNHQETPA